MKYSGTIVGFQSNFGSIYNIIIDDTRCYAWKANVTAQINENMILITFNWNGETYEIKLSQLKEYYYRGKIAFNREPGGEAFFWSFHQNDNLILKGDFSESGAGNYECFIELKPIKDE